MCPFLQVAHSRNLGGIWTCRGFKPPEIPHYHPCEMWREWPGGNIRQLRVFVAKITPKGTSLASQPRTGFRFFGVTVQRSIPVV